MVSFTNSIVSRGRSHIIFLKNLSPWDKFSEVKLLVQNNVTFSWPLECIILNCSLKKFLPIKMIYIWTSTIQPGNWSKYKNKTGNKIRAYKLLNKWKKTTKGPWAGRIKANGNMKLSQPRGFCNKSIHVLNTVPQEN